jgi:hypothetical protein
LLTVLAVRVAVFIVVDLVFRVVPRDEIGPVGAACALAVAVGLGFLGVCRATAAGHPRVGTVSFAVPGLDSATLARRLATEHGIGVRDGCSAPIR